MDSNEYKAMRRAFEARVKPMGYDLRVAKNDPRDYFIIATHALWVNWQASWKEARAYEGPATPAPVRSGVRRPQPSAPAPVPRVTRTRPG